MMHDGPLGLVWTDGLCDCLAPAGPDTCVMQLSVHVVTHAEYKIISLLIKWKTIFIDGMWNVRQSAVDCQTANSQTGQVQIVLDRLLDNLGTDGPTVNSLGANGPTVDCQLVGQLMVRFLTVSTDSQPWDILIVRPSDCR